MERASKKKRKIVLVKGEKKAEMPNVWNVAAEPKTVPV